MLGNESLWTVALNFERLLSQSGIPYSICGGVAVCLHGYKRNTTDIDVIIQSTDIDWVKELLIAELFVWHPQSSEFRSSSGVPVRFLMGGEQAGKGSEVTIPKPQVELNREHRDGLPVVRLSRLIEMKLASGLGSMRRTHKDFADVVELIAIRNLDSSFARHLHPSVRPAFRDHVQRVNNDD